MNRFKWVLRDIRERQLRSPRQKLIFRIELTILALTILVILLCKLDLHESLWKF